MIKMIAFLGVWEGGRKGTQVCKPWHSIEYILLQGCQVVVAHIEISKRSERCETCQGGQAKVIQLEHPHCAE